MKIKVFTEKKINNDNAYLVINEEQKTGLLIDTACSPLDILAYIKQEGIKLENIIITHGHWDHIKGLDTIVREIPGAHIWIGKRDRKDLHSAWDNLSLFSKLTESWKMSFVPVLTPVNKVTERKLSEFKVKLIPAPGHTPGALFAALPDEHVVFTGDTVFINGDDELFGERFWKGNLCYNPIKFNKTLSMFLKDFSDKWKIYPGHWEYGWTMENIPEEK